MRWSTEVRSGGRMKWIGAASAGALLAVVALTGSASGGPSDDKENDQSQVVTWQASDGTRSVDAAVAVAPTQKNLEFVAFSAGCRFLDTRISGGAFAADQFRDLSVLDAGIPAGLGPCGVPARAKAVQLSLSTIGGSPTATGYTRVGPGGVDPTATVLQFLAGQGVSVTTNATLSATGTLRVKSYLAGSGYTGDLLGYWQEPVWGRVSADGVLTAGSGVVSITKSTSFAGDYYIYTDRTLAASCAPAVMLEDSTTRVLGFVSSTYLYVDVRFYASIAEADGTFNFLIQC